MQPKRFLPVIMKRLGIREIKGICLAANKASVKALERRPMAAFAQKRPERAMHRRPPGVFSFPLIIAAHEVGFIHAGQLVQIEGKREEVA